jgi:hypothetical protein
VRACTSSNSRAFSIAITAWSANALMSATCLPPNSFGSWRAVPMAPITFPSRIMGAKITELNPNSSANCTVADGVAGFSSTGANCRVCFESIARPPTVLSSTGRG